MPKKQSTSSKMETIAKNDAPASHQSTSGRKENREPRARTRSSSPVRSEKTESTTLLPGVKPVSEIVEQTQDPEKETLILPEKGPTPQITVEDFNNKYVERSLNFYDLHSTRAIDYEQTYPRRWPEEIQHAFGMALDWARNYAERKHANLSMEQKRDLVSSLDGYCIQNNFDTIVSSLPRSLHNMCLTQLVYLLLVKECISRFFTNPFWYLVPDPERGGDADDKGKLPTNAPVFGAQIFNLYERMRESDPAAAQLWRLWTTRFSHPDHKFGYDMIAHRDSVADRICEEILGQEPVKSLLRSTDKSVLDRARIDLQKFFRPAAELSVKISCQLQYLEFRFLNTLDPVFHHPSAEIDLAEDYGGATKEPCFDGRRILFLEFPAMYVCGDSRDPFYRGVQRKAVVYVEDVVRNS
ncbi:NADH:flavin oxidoreductase / NADH oxidase family protein [Aspergillus niger]|uniref:Contig An05c0050, genomic contig n=3 Tax=Aspergillus niger TaxID=5061 RepID=A2QKY9_ASPNC|nr:uncharacterized protein BO96DRAFT_476549 [Aspergillus niger CBS 101883]XP_059606086.1 uncharacterized protein An05g01910 [Aspergillus niger]RDH16570.1 hypothetical protein M747DRAFT_358594 [Aspergillus niger ATCC 13496]PYH55561.1 hypothetical protein BO96DRAFT_476549 [Aspergillus niger CBS 101883]CAK96526.1 unnamed protein product [Aspergillus niger]GJP96888.1 NADH:flavin oxidoreductase / NADH oxidase family protein [Aspergillus niger]